MVLLGRREERGLRVHGANGSDTVHAVTAKKALGLKFEMLGWCPSSISVAVQSRTTSCQHGISAVLLGLRSCSEPHVFGTH